MVVEKIKQDAKVTFWVKDSWVKAVEMYFLLNKIPHISCMVNRDTLMVSSGKGFDFINENVDAVIKSIDSSGEYPKEYMVIRIIDFLVDKVRRDVELTFVLDKGDHKVFQLSYDYACIVFIVDRVGGLRVMVDQQELVFDPSEVGPISMSHLIEDAFYTFRRKK